MPLAAESVDGLVRSPELRGCLDWFRRERAWINEQHLALCRIPSATFFEQKRAEWMAETFRTLGWESKLDRAGNVIAWRPGRKDDAAVAITAHLDTVLAPHKSEDIVVSGDGRLLGPGVADNGAGLAGLLAIAAAWTASPPPETPWAPVLIANVGEEGEGNLSGMRYLCRNPDTPGSFASRLRAFLVLDGPGMDRITARALASRRYDVSISGPGGHSWSDYGLGNPVHALARVVSYFSDHLPEPGDPRFSYNFGLIQGGSSINAIPSEARAKIDLRSTDAAVLDRISELLTEAVTHAVESENARATLGRVTARIREIGSRPAGELPPHSALLEYLAQVDAHLGVRSVVETSSTDANIPLSLGIPAVSIGAGGDGGGAHTATEWYSPESRDRGLRRVFLTLFLLLSDPTLA